MVPKLSGSEPAGLSCVGSYAGEIPQSATKAKNDKIIEGRIGVGMGRFTQEPINKAIKNFTKTLRTCVETGGGHIEHKL